MKKLIAFIGIIILVVPSVLSGYFYGKAVKEEKARERLLSIVVTSPDSKEYTYSADVTDDADTVEAVRLFRSLASLKEKSDKSTDELAALGDCFTVKYITTHGEHLTSVYTVKKDTGILIYFVSGSGVLCFDEAARNSFLSSEFALCIYDASSLPVLLVSGSDVVPFEAEWKIKLANGEYSDIDTSGLTNENPKVDNYSGASSLAFSVAPDVYTVKVKNEAGDVLFSGDSYAYAEFKTDRSMDVQIEIEAMWYQVSNKNYYGHAKFSFSASVTADPVFTLSATHTQPGSAILLSCLNIPLDVELKAETYPEICDIKLYRDGTNLYTFIPISYNVAPGDYTLRLFYSGKNEILPFTVTNKTYLNSTPFSSSLISAEKVEACLNETAVAEYAALLSSVAASDSGTLYYSGRLGDYQKLFTLYKGFGYGLSFEGSALTTRNDGVYFTAKEGSILTSMGKGKVCAAGECAYLGKYVAVDHGYGLRSWYANLDEISCSVGDIVENGERIGTSGTSGLALKGKTWVMITVDSVPVSPYQFWEQTINFVK